MRDGSPSSPNSTSDGGGLNCPPLARSRAHAGGVAQSAGGGKPILQLANASKPSICVEPLFAPARKGDVKNSLADISLAHELLNYEVNVDFTEGIKRTVEWYLKLKFMSSAG
ncbi:MAG: hypothetical protein JW914_05825 [Syntrophaceae bacterium]|nr:hypothetical protein [Syntrophaceae bacterium]